MATKAEHKFNKQAATGKAEREERIALRIDDLFAVYIRKIVRYHKSRGSLERWSSGLSDMAKGATSRLIGAIIELQ